MFWTHERGTTQHSIKIQAERSLYVAQRLQWQTDIGSVEKALILYI